MNETLNELWLYKLWKVGGVSKRRILIQVLLLHAGLDGQWKPVGEAGLA